MSGPHFPASERSAARSHQFARALVVLSALSTSCTLALHRDRDQCSTSADCQRLEAGSVCTADGLCEQVTPASKRLPDACVLDTDCTDPWSVCRGNLCVAVSYDGCKQLGSLSASDPRERLVLGVLVPSGELEGTTPPRVFGAVQTAINELDRVGAAAPGAPQVGALACDETLSGSLDYLLNELEVQALIGPEDADSLAAIRGTVSDKAVLFAPYADAPSLDLRTPDSPTDAALVSCRPNRSEVSAALLNGIDFVRNNVSAIKNQEPTVLTFSDSERQLGFETAFTDVSSNTVQRVDYGSSVDLASALMTELVSSSLLVATSGEVDWRDNISAVDSALPFYLLSDEQLSVFDLVTHDATLDKSARQSDRVLGLQYPLDPELHEQFVNAFEAETGDAASPALDYVNDCTYLAVYSAIAAEIRFSLNAAELNARAILIGLSALSGGTDRYSVGAEDIAGVVTALEQGRGETSSIQLARSSGDEPLLGLLPVLSALDGVTGAYVRPQANGLELYCVNPQAFCETGLIFTDSGGPRDAGESQCECFPK